MRAEGRPEREETLPRREAARAALCRLDDLAREPWLPRGLADTLRHRYAHTLGHVPESLDPADLDRDHVAAHARLRGEVVRAKRLALIDLRDRGAIGDDALKRVEHDLDLEELHTGI